MSAENPDAAATPAAPTSSGVTQEIPKLDQARQNFHAKVQAFVNEYEKHDPEIIDRHDPKDSSVEPYQKLKEFLKDKLLPKRDQENEIVAVMQILRGQLDAKLRKEVTEGKRLQAVADETSTKMFQHAEAAEDAEKQFKAAYQEDQKISKATPTGFVDGQDLFRYSEKDQMGTERFTVMSTKNTREGFQAALEDYANSIDDKGNSRRYGNINFTNPPVDENKLRNNWQYKEYMHEKVIDALNKGLYPENAIRQLMGALVGPSLNARANWSSEAKRKEAQIQQLKDAITGFKDAKEGKGPKEPANLQSKAVPQKKAAATPANKDAADAARLNIKPTVPKLGG